MATTALAREHVAARVDCSVTAVTFLFWPQGHDAIPSIKFPSYRFPHMEVYKTSSGTYPDPNELAVIEFTPSGQVAGGFAKSCLPAHTKVIDSRPARAKTTLAKTLRCKFPRPVQLDFAKHTAPIAIDLTATLRTKSIKASLEVQAYITSASGGPGGSTLRYNPKHCKAYPPPH